MDLYSGTKIIKAQPMSLGNYNIFKGWTIPENEDAASKGYLVGYSNADGEFNGPLMDGCHHISWSPKDVFDMSYKPSGEMTFGMAIEAAKNGNKVARTGWNGKRMYAVIMPGYPKGVKVDKQIAKIHNVFVGAVMTFRPYWVLKTAQDDISTWAPSGSDSLAEDWCIVS